MTITIGEHTLRVEGVHIYDPGDNLTQPKDEYDVHRVWFCYGGREREIRYELSQIELIEEYHKQC